MVNNVYFTKYIGGKLEESIHTAQDTAFPTRTCN